MSPLQQLFASLGGQAILLAAVGWLIKTLVSQSLTREAERFKAQLQLENEAFRSKLEIDAHQQTTVFSRLHEKRAETIADAYRLLSVAELAVRSMVAPFQLSGEPDPHTKMHKSAEAIGELQAQFEATRIWFKPSTCEKADAVLVELRQIHNHFNIVVRARERRGEGESNADEWLKTWERVEQKVPTLKAALEKDFREILGVEDSTNIRPATAAR